jgi:hypothetical protein
VDRFFSGGGAGLWKSGQFQDYDTYHFDLDTREWEFFPGCPSASIGSTSAVGPDGRVWMHGAWGSASVLTAWDPVAKTWTKHANTGGEWIGYYKTAEIDPLQHKYVLIGEGSVRVWDLDNPGNAYTRPSMTGASGAGLSHPGAAWDPKTKEILVWSGGAIVYSLNVATSHWTAHTTTGMNTTPPTAAGTGTNGRWRYVPSRDVFVNVNSTSGNVFVYRHTK